MYGHLAPSLFEASGGEALGSAVGWLTGTLLGSVAVMLCVIAVAMVGLLMLGGRMLVRQAAMVVIGCFVVLGAPIIAASFIGAGREVVGTTGPAEVSLPDRAERPALPPPDYDPYAGASFRQD